MITPDGGTGREVEAKLAITDRDALSLASLAEALGPNHRLLPLGRLVMTDAYFDTAAFDLLRAGFAARVRGAPAGVKVTLKSLDRPGFNDLVVQRLELEGPVADPARPLDPGGWPEALRAQVLAVLGEAPELAPYCLLYQERDTFRLLPEPAVADAADPVDGTPLPPPLAELSLDAVTVYAPPLPGTTRGGPRFDVLSRGQPAGQLAELELELAATGDEAALRAVAKRLAKRLGLAPSTGSKLERALYLLADHSGEGAADPELGGIGPNMTMAEAGRLMWRRQLTTMLLTEAGARRGTDIEYVHDFRVATRRARAVARLFGPYYRPKAVAPMLKDLRRTARALGAVRDLDVALAKLRKYARSRPEAERDGFGELAAEWRILRRQAYRDLLTWLDSPGYREFIRRFAVFCHSPGAGVATPSRPADAGPAPQQVRHVMPSAILNRFEQVRAYEPLFEAGPAVPMSQLHALRIDCKALRYSLEPVEHLLGAEGSELVGQLKALQDLLGDLNDAVVTHERLEAMLTGGLPPEGATEYLAYQSAAATDLAAKAPAAWRAFTGPDNRRLLALAIARL